MRMPLLAAAALVLTIGAMGIVIDVRSRAVGCPPQPTRRAGATTLRTEPRSGPRDRAAPTGGGPRYAGCP